MLVKNMINEICKARARRTRSDCYIAMLENEMKAKKLEVHKYRKDIMVMDQKACSGKFFSNWDDVEKYITERPEQKSESICHVPQEL